MDKYISFELCTELKIGLKKVKGQYLTSDCYSTVFLRISKDRQKICVASTPVVRFVLKVIATRVYSPNDKGERERGRGESV